MGQKIKEKLEKKVLLFTPHPDDNLCCAGTLMFLRDKGFKIYEVVATGGEAGDWWVSDTKRKIKFKREELKETRKQEINQVAQLIGIEKVSFLGLPDSRVEKSFEVINQVIKIIRREKPEIVLFGNSYDYHSDHRELSQIIKEGLERASWTIEPRLGKPHRVPIALCWEGMYFGKAHFLVDITPYLERKRQAVDVYASQIYPNERRLLEAMNDYRGFFLRDHQLLAAEAFEIPEEFPIDLKRLVEIFETGW